MMEINNIIKNFILNMPRLVKLAVLVSCDLFICATCVWLSFGILLGWWGSLFGQRWMVLIISIILFIPTFVKFGLYRAIIRFIGPAVFTSIVKAFVVYTILFFCIFTIIGIDNIPRSIGIIQPLLLFIGIGISRYFVRYWLNGSRSIQGGGNVKQSIALIYGTGLEGRQLAAGLAFNKDIFIKGFIDDSKLLHGRTISGLEIFHINNLKLIIYQLGITDILLAIPAADAEYRKSVISSLSGYGVRVRTIPKFLDLTSGQVGLSDINELDLNDLLGRIPIPPNIGLLESNVTDKTVLVTGAGGSIGGELCRQIIKLHPRALILIDVSEYSLYLIYEELKRCIATNKNLNFSSGSLEVNQIKLVPYLASVVDRNRLLGILKGHNPDTIFHAAAYKHVPLVEQNIVEGIRNNTFGTLNVAQVAYECGVPNFILISTDKAVRPTNVMGASKRIAELILQAMNQSARNENRLTKFSMVRFGNVLGSSGSVAPLFSLQIKSGGPITLTHPDVTRYFMTIPEAAELVIQASSMASGGDVYVLDMGQPVRIYDLAVKMIFLSGLMLKNESNPEGDIEIKVTGLRPGEKLYEELLIGNDPQLTQHPKIMKAHEEFLSWEELKIQLDHLSHAMLTGDVKSIQVMLQKIVPGYQPDKTGTNFLSD